MDVATVRARFVVQRFSVYWIITDVFVCYEDIPHPLLNIRAHPLHPPVPPLDPPKPLKCQVSFEHDCFFRGFLDENG